MTRANSPLALFLAVTLLLPGEVHVLTGGCLPGMHGAAMVASMQAPDAQAPGTTDCGAHHPGQGPVRGGMQHCGAPSTCAAGMVFFEPAPLTAGTQEYAGAPESFVTTPHSLTTPPGTPPPRR